MAKKALLDVLEQTIGKYVKNLDAESLNVAVWSGSIRLQGLQVDTVAVNRELRGFHVTEGHLDKLAIQVPWTHLTSQPVVVTIDGLSLSVTPSSAEPEVSHSTNAADTRTQALDAADRLRQPNLDPSFGSRLVRRIVENLQIEIRNVHVRILSPDGSSAGVVLSRLQLATTNAQGIPSFVDRKDPFLHKLLDLEGLGVYMDGDSVLSSIREEDEDEGEHTFVLAPLSFQARLRQADSNECIDFPKYLLTSELQALSLILSRSQLEQAHSLLQQLPTPAPQPLFPQYRPTVPVHGHAKEWWQYARRAVGRLTGKRGWHEFWHAFAQRQSYLRLYGNDLTEGERARLVAIEQDRSISVEGIMAWRNIVDAKKAKKKNTGWGGFFGSGKDASVQLSVEELKELESVTDQSSLSAESRLCDVRFVLGSLKLHLSTFGLRQLASLEMGTVSWALDAKSDGSFSMESSLESLYIHDRSTPQTLFPTILKNRQEGSAAFSLQLSKTAKGDGTLRAKLDTFEAVASPGLLLELQRFLSFKNNAPPVQVNPILAQSMSGSVDLFYDAAPLAESSVLSPLVENDLVDTNGDISATLIDAWNFKREHQAAWSIDLDLRAPVVAIPQNCVDPRAPLLVLDFGHFLLHFGKVNGSEDVRRWIDERPKTTKETASVDYGSIAVQRLTFSVGSNADWKSLVRQPGVTDDAALIEPLSLWLQFGLETRVSDSIPRICVFGKIPSIVMGAKPSQLARIMAVGKSWQKQFADSSAVGENVDGDDQRSIASSSTVGSRVMESAARIGTQLLASTECEEATVFSRFTAEFALQRFSIAVVSDTGDGMEMHLVSLVASTSVLSNSHVSASLSMGWFWILDRIRSDFPRRQRLFAHSSLPKTAEVYADSGDFDILADLVEIGALDDHFQGSNDLADIKLWYSNGKGFGSEDPFSAKKAALLELDADTVVDARFSSLRLNWNPKATKTMLRVLSGFAEFLSAWDQQDTGSLILVGRESIRSPSSRKEVQECGDVVAQRQRSASLVVRAKLRTLELSLHSALDDLPLFSLRLTNAEVSLSSAGSLGSWVALRIGDLSAVSSPLGRTLDAYRTVVGMKPGVSVSLLDINFYDGVRAMTMVAHDVDAEVFESYASILLSPLRLVYIQAQVMALVEYTTEGILGALTSTAASSAVAVAADLAETSGRKKLFRVVGEGIQVALPTSAVDGQALTLDVGQLSLDYEALSEPGGGCVQSRIDCVQILDVSGASLMDEPVSMDFDVSVPPDSVGSKDDQTIRVSCTMPVAVVSLCRHQYGQIMLMLEGNMQESRLYLRDTEINSVENDDTDQPEWFGLTHTGVAENVEPRRVDVHVSSDTLTLRLLDSIDEPIAVLETSAARFSLLMEPDKEALSFAMKIGGLHCEDQRIQALGRQHRTIMERVDESSSGDMVCLSYSQSQEMSTSITVDVGSTEVIVIPDAIVAILSVFHRDTSSPSHPSPPRHQPIADMMVDNHQTSTVVEVDSESQEREIEANLVSRSTQLTKSLKYKLGTARCSIVLVDLGSDSTSAITSSIGRPAVSSVTEVIVLRGSFHADATCEVGFDSGQLVRADGALNGDELEVYTATGKSQESPVQIIDPVNVAVHASLRSEMQQSRVIDLRLALVTPVEIYCSMKNIALVNAIASGISDIAPGDSTQPPRTLSPKETERIRRLASILAKTDSDAETPWGTVSPDTTDAYCATSNSLLSRAGDDDSIAPSRDTLSVKLTLPQTRLTLINDLQGVDEALLRVTVRNLVAASQVRQNEPSEVGYYVGFDINAHTSLLADYFDSEAKLWKKLLVRPWEVSLKGMRTASQRSDTGRISSTLDVESLPCSLSFSEKLLTSLASANRMWAVYSSAASSEVDAAHDRASTKLRRSMAATAARTFVSSLPYAIDNRSGRNLKFSVTGIEASRLCRAGDVEYFRFDPPRGIGTGGKRLYGQDFVGDKRLLLQFAVGPTIVVPDIDKTRPGVTTLHSIGGDSYAAIQVLKEGKTTVVHVGSGVDIRNSSPVRFLLCVDVDGLNEEIGELAASCTAADTDASVSVISSLRAPKTSRPAGIPIHVVDRIHRKISESGVSTFALSMYPQLASVRPPLQLKGVMNVDFDVGKLRSCPGGMQTIDQEVVCMPFHDEGKAIPRDCGPFVVRVSVVLSLAENMRPCASLCLTPRATVINQVPVPIRLRSPMPYLFAYIGDNEPVSEDHLILPGQRLEVFTSGPSIACAVELAEAPVGGSATEWMGGGSYVDLPLLPMFRLLEPLRCSFPMSSHSETTYRSRSFNSVEFYIVQGRDALDSISDASHGLTPESGTPDIELSEPSVGSEDWRTFTLTVCNYAVDHTGDILFAKVVSAPSTRSTTSSLTDPRLSQRSFSELSGPALGTYRSHRHMSRISLLPMNDTKVRLLHLTMDGEDGLRRSSPFSIDDITMSEGGLDATPITWESGSSSGFFAYRKLVNSHQSEVHVVPEYVVYNGDTHNMIRVRQPGGVDMVVAAGKIGRLDTHSSQTATISIVFMEIGAQSSPIRVDSLGLRIAIVKSLDGSPVGSVAIQTVVGAQDSRLVVKVGAVKLGSDALPQLMVSPPQESLFANDIVRFRIQLSELRLTVNEAPPIVDTRQGFFESAMDRIRDMGTNAASTNVPSDPKAASKPLESEEAVCTLIFMRSTIDWQRLFKDQPKEVEQSLRGLLTSPERSQLSIIVHNVQILDESQDSPYPIVLNSTSQAHFFDLCVRFRGPTNSDLVRVDLLDLNLACADGQPQSMTLNSTEEFIWKLLDLADRIVVAASDFAGVDIELKWDDEHDGYNVSIKERKSSFLDMEGQYYPPQSDTIYDLAKMRVSPFSVVVSFKRTPQSTRYKKLKGVKGANIMNYFTHRLKFKIEKAELKFARYEATNVKGPIDAVIERLSTVYVSRMKMKMVSIMSAASIQDWKYLAARESGDDAFVEGDILRVTGNLAGNGFGYAFKKAGAGIGSGVSTLTRTVGDGIEGASEVIGVRHVGAGLNSVVSGVGDGVGDTVTGLGSGAGKFIKGAGQGAGHIFGGGTSILRSADFIIAHISHWFLHS